MSYRLFLDDIRSPIDCVTYMHSRIGAKNPIYLKDWVVVRDYSEFTECITLKGLPEVISFDHDLAIEHYAPEERWDGSYNEWATESGFTEKTGADCAKWLVEYCNKIKASLPDCYVHSMNPVGAQNIINVLINKQ